jgi:hypothetical protein
MGRIGIGDRLNQNSKKNIIFEKEYRKVRLDPRTLIPSEHNKYSQEKIEELADNMILVGQLQEIIVGRVNGQDRIIVGHRRTAAAVLNIERGHDEFKLVDCKIREMSESLFMLTLHSANIFNRQLSDWELTNGVAEFTQYLIQARDSGELTIEGKMRDYIANITGKSTGKINQINSINNNLCEEGKEAFKDGKMNFSTAYETSRLPEEKQKEVLENGELLSTDVREMVKEEKKKKEAEKRPGDDYEPAHPESITSLCYSCLYYSECNVKTGTCQKCDQYRNKAEAEKTEEQRYEEEQDAIDRETRAKLRQQEDEKKMEKLPSEAVAAEPKTHVIRLATMYYDDVASGKKSFELRKNDRDYKVGDILDLMEFAEGRCTGRTVKADIVYVLENYSGLQEGYCILGIKIVGDNE